MAVTCSSQTLSDGWMLKQGDRTSSEEWLPVTKVPSEVHLDLLANEKISDPFLDLNELSTRWVGEETWTYRTNFPTPKVDGDKKVAADLIFEGLDTFAAIYVNGELVLETENAFVEHRISLQNRVYLATAEESVLEIVFEPARKKGLELVKQYPEHRFIVHQTEISRGPVRKPQYHWGWDWGPILLSVGPWKPIVLETYSCRIESFQIKYHIEDDLSRVAVEFFASLSGPCAPNIRETVQPPFPRVSFQVLKDGNFLSKEDKGLTNHCPYTTNFHLDNPKLWWPYGYGAQDLYELRCQIIDDDGELIDEQRKFIGFRKTELVQEKDDFGTSFYFRINNIDIFAGGSCWIPTDSFLSRIEPERYREWMKLMVEGNQIMVRVWGGGIYESDDFYNACDELGVLVWQDFAFACANYPAYPSYLASVETEARQAIRRLRHHPSLIIWAGNNEDYQIVERYELEYNFKDKDTHSWLKTNFPARYIYEHLLPDLVHQEHHGGGALYHPSSPWGNGKSTVLKVDPTVGDVHQWNVWHGEMKPYQWLPHMGGRFVSEFGMEAYPHLETIENAITEPTQRFPGSLAMDFRNKAVGHERRLINYVAENFQVKYNLPAFTHLTQIVQSEAVYWAYKSWRRQWGKSGSRQCGGVLVWQLNDCWPTMSWAVVDYYLVKKPAWYAMKRALQPVTVGVTRKFCDWTIRHADELWQRDTGHIDPTAAVRDVRFDVWAASRRMEKIAGSVQIKFISVKTGKEVSGRTTEDVDIESNGTTEIAKDRKVPETAVTKSQDEKVPFDTATMDPFVIEVTLSVDGNVIAKDVSWPDPIKYLDLSDRDLEVSYSENKKTATITAAKPVKGFVFSEKRGVVLSDNGFDIMPGDKKEVYFEGIDAAKLEWRYVGM